MQVETTLAVHDWLKREDHGVNYWLDRMQVDPIHPRPPAIAYFGNPYDPQDNRCARSEAPPNYPALYITPDGFIDVEPEVHTRSRDSLGPGVGVAIKYLTRNAATGVDNAMAAYTMKAIAASLRLFLAELPEGRAARTRGSVSMFAANRMTYGPWRQAIGDAHAIAAFALQLDVRENVPNP